MRIRHDIIRQQVLDRDKTILELKSDVDRLTGQCDKLSVELKEEATRTENTGDCRTCGRPEVMWVVNILSEKSNEILELKRKISALEKPWYKKDIGVTVHSWLKKDISVIVRSWFASKKD